MGSIVVRPNGNLVVTVRLTLRPGRDDELIALVRQAPRGALAGLVREAMRNGIRPLLPEGVAEPAAEEDELDLSGLGLEL